MGGGGGETLALTIGSLHTQAFAHTPWEREARPCVVDQLLWLAVLNV